MYASKADILTLYGEDFLLDVLPSDVTDQDATIAHALSGASAEIDGYLSVRYALPLATNPDMLIRPAIDIAVYVMANRHSRLTEAMEKRYEEAVELLTKISTGKAGLGRAEPKIDSGDNSPASASGAAFSARPRRFDRGAL